MLRANASRRDAWSSVVRSSWLLMFVYGELIKRVSSGSAECESRLLGLRWTGPPCLMSPRFEHSLRAASGVCIMAICALGTYSQLCMEEESTSVQRLLVPALTCLQKSVLTHLALPIVLCSIVSSQRWYIRHMAPFLQAICSVHELAVRQRSSRRC